MMDLGRGGDLIVVAQSKGVATLRKYQARLVLETVW